MNKRSIHSTAPPYIQLKQAISTALHKAIYIVKQKI